MPVFKNINYITNLPVKEFSGGWSGMNHHIYLQLKKQFKVNLVENINPAYSFTDKLFSKFCRLAGLKGKFVAFTNERLNCIKNEAETKLDTTADLNFYHGATPWLHVANKIPYVLYLDACFGTYIKAYHNQTDFSVNQLNELFKKESVFLNNAQAVFFSSAWAMNDAKKIYSLPGQNLFVAGLGCGIDSMSVSNTETHTDKIFEFWGENNYKKSTIHLPQDVAQETKDFLDTLNSLPNVVMHGAVSTEILAEGIKRMDTLLISYAIKDDQNHHKVLEYLGTGNVIITSYMSSYVDLPGLMEMVSSKTDNAELPVLFNQVIGNIEKYNSTENRKKRIDYATGFTYQSQVKKIESYLTAVGK